MSDAETNNLRHIDPNPVRPGPIRHQSLDAKLLEQIRTIYDVLGGFFDMTLEQFEIGFMRDSNPAHEVGVWAAVMVVWIDYHEKYLDDEIMSDADERKLLSALISISSGVEDPAKLGVPVLIGKRLLDCYEKLEQEVEANAENEQSERQ